MIKPHSNLWVQTIFAFLILSLHPFMGTAQNFDIELLRKINLNRNQNLDPAFKVVTNSVSPMIIAVPAGMIVATLIGKDTLQKQKTIFVCGSVLTAALITTSLKYAVDRPRPFVTYPDIDIVTPAGSPSFPSGHTSASFSLATSMSIAYPKWYVIAPSFVWAGTVAYSRMDLGAHYPSDVLAGAIIGSGSAYLCYRLNKWYLKKR